MIHRLKKDKKKIMQQPINDFNKEKFHIYLNNLNLIKLEILNKPPKDGFYLYYQEKKLILKHVNLNLTLSIDFKSTDMKNRIRLSTAKTDLIKAIEGKNKKILNILDMTVGFGQDSFSLAARGHVISAIENNPYVFLLLHNGLKRAEKEECLSIIAKKITLYFANSLTYNIILGSKKYDVIYLDPMFPKRDKSAKVKKNMQLLHELIGIDEVSPPLLFQQAKLLKPKKIVVKRPRLGKLISDDKPSSQIISKSSRFDIYALTVI